MMKVFDSCYSLSFLLALVFGLGCGSKKADSPEKLIEIAMASLKDSDYKTFQACLE